jgi:hypothetical protein
MFTAAFLDELKALSGADHATVTFGKEGVHAVFQYGALSVEETFPTKHCDEETAARECAKAARASGAERKAREASVIAKVLDDQALTSDLLLTGTAIVGPDGNRIAPNDFHISAQAEKVKDWALSDQFPNPPNTSDLSAPLPVKRRGGRPRKVKAD